MLTTIVRLRSLPTRLAQQLRNSSSAAAPDVEIIVPDKLKLFPVSSSTLSATLSYKSEFPTSKIFIENSKIISKAELADAAAAKAKGPDRGRGNRNQGGGDKGGVDYGLINHKGLDGVGAHCDFLLRDVGVKAMEVRTKRRVAEVKQGNTNCVLEYETTPGKLYFISLLIDWLV